LLPFDTISNAADILRQFFLNASFEYGVLNVAPLQTIVQQLIFRMSGKIISSVENFFAGFFEFWSFITLSTASL
jgi:hypothetical protein